MSKKNYVINSAKKSTDLAATYNKAKTEADKFDLQVATPLKEEVVATAMTSKKKQADFFIEIETGTNFIKLDFVCEVKGAGKWVLGRKMIKSFEEYQKNEALAKNLHMNMVKKECNW